MKKKVAVFANTWNFDIVSSFLKDFVINLPKDSVDTFVFLAANSYGRSPESNTSEISIHYSFPHFEDFDAAVVFSQGLNSNEDREKIYENCEKAGIPTFCIGDEHPGFYSLLIHNSQGMRELCEHLYSEHNVRNVAFVAGPRENGDSNIRLETVREFAKEKGITFTDDNICYTDWEVRRCMDYVLDNYRDKSKLPDAMIFANDFLAISGAMAFDTLGYNVPKDVLVTGFDFVQSGQTYFPSIATIDQRYDYVGEVCAKSIADIIEGKTVPEKQYIDAIFRPGESCGCDNPRNEDELRRKYCHSLIGKEYIENARTGNMYSLRSAFQESNRFSTLPQKLQNVFYAHNQTDVSTIHIMIDPTIERVGTEEIPNLPKYKYAEKFQIAVSLKNGEPLETGTINKRDIVPHYTSEGENETYIVMPLYIDSFVVGYFIMGLNKTDIKDWLYQEYSACMIQSLTYYKTNIRLTALNDKLSELMQTDALTSLKNRTAFENAKKSLRNHYLADDDLRFAAVMFDLNDLKKINDEYGHGAGDLYIKNSSELICNTFKHSPVFRVGGDEFVAIVKNSDYEIRYELLNSFREEIERLRTADVPPTKKISVASGMADFDEIENEDIETLFKKADDRMYENKREMKANRQ